jgi:hypothetical protein
MANTKAYVSISRLAKYDEMLKSKMEANDAMVLASAKEFAKNLGVNYEPAGAAATAKAEAIEASRKEIDILANGAVKSNTEAIAAIKDGALIDSFSDTETALNNTAVKIVAVEEWQRNMVEVSDAEVDNLFN